MTANTLAALACAVVACGRTASAAGPSDIRTGTRAPATAVPLVTTKAAPKQTVTYIVTGSAASVQYGPAGSNASGTVPMHVTRKLGSPVYYAVSAQLTGGGKVTCKLEVNGKVISKAAASGSFNIAQCEISQDPLSGRWIDTNAGWTAQANERQDETVGAAKLRPFRRWRGTIST